jgi:hypothetical protein
MDVGDFLIRWSVRIALALYVLALLLRIARRNRSARFLWTAGCLAFLVHVVAAFHFAHHWSHAAAYAETARQTAEVVGLDWGGGIYFNYLLSLIWMIDVLWWSWCPKSYLTRSRWIEWFVQGFMAFIWLNATVVFGHGAIRWVGLIGIAIVIIATLARAAGFRV